MTALPQVISRLERIGPHKNLTEKRESKLKTIETIRGRIALPFVRQAATISHDALRHNWQGVQPLAKLNAGQRTNFRCAKSFCR
jgi:hypothetical protein